MNELTKLAGAILIVIALPTLFLYPPLGLLLLTAALVLNLTARSSQRRTDKALDEERHQELLRASRGDA